MADSQGFKVKNKMELKKHVLKHLQEKGFNCIAQSKPAFPDIIAWKPFMDMQGKSPILHTQTIMGSEVTNKSFIPFFVTLVECKKNKKLNKKEKAAVKIILDENRCNLFLIAYKEKGKLEFTEIETSNKIPTAEIIKKERPSYLG